jgi:hypothetical protein
MDSARKASFSALWEILPIFEFLLSYFEVLEKEAKTSKFNTHRGIQNSI